MRFVMWARRREAGIRNAGLLTDERHPAVEAWAVGAPLAAPFLFLPFIVVATTEAAMARGEQVQYRNWATPDAMVGLLRVLQEGKGLSASSRRLLLGLMTASKTGPGRIKGLLPEGTVVAHKTGSSGTVHGLTRATNDVGLVTLPDGKHLAVVVFVSDTKAGEATRDAVIAKIARAAWNDRAALEGRR